MYSDSEVLAEQENNTVKWKHVNPLTGSQSESDTSGGFVVTVESDPMGINVGVEDPFVDPEPVGFIPESETPMIGGLGWGGGCSSLDPNCRKCFVDGFMFDCEQVAFMQSVGSAERAAPSTVWGNGRWNFVRFNPDTGQYMARVFAGYTYTSVTIDGRTTGRWQPQYDSIVVGSQQQTNGFFSYGWTQLGSNSRPYQTLHHATPQQTAPNVDNLRRDVAEVLSNPKCSEFVKTLINGVATSQNPAHSTDALKLFDTIRSQKGFVYERVVQDGVEINTVRGAIRLNDAQVLLNPSNAIGLRFAVNRYNTALTTLHEIIHLAGKNGYSDPTLAAAVRGMPGSSPPKGDITKVSPASEYWNEALRAACFPAGVR